jgi:hypothetical protein
MRESVAYIVLTGIQMRMRGSNYTSSGSARDGSIRQAARHKILPVGRLRGRWLSCVLLCLSRTPDNTVLGKVRVHPKSRP